MSTGVIGEWDREITLLDLADLGNEGWELAGYSQQAERSTTFSAITKERLIFKGLRPYARARRRARPFADMPLQSDGSGQVASRLTGYAPRFDFNVGFTKTLQGAMTPK
jgi:hypothetical protein